jgi:hypothetical protein
MLNILLSQAAAALALVQVDRMAAAALALAVIEIPMRVKLLAQILLQSLN